MKLIVSNKELVKVFRKLNDRFFNNEIPDYNVVFKNIQPDGECDFERGEIRINKDLRRHPNLAFLILFHEMNHAHLGPEYIGLPSNGGHGMRFQAGLVRLFNMGAYEELL